MLEELYNFLSPQVIASLISFLGVIISVIFADSRAKRTAKNEVKKLKMQWQREDDMKEDYAFSNINTAVSRYIQSGWSRHQREALEAISALQPISDTDFFSALADLEIAVASNDTTKTTAALANVNQLWRRCVKGKSK